MTEIAQIYLGNINQNSDLETLVKQQDCWTISLQHSDRTKGRIHGHSSAGVAIGIIKSRDRALESGDVFQTDSGKLLVIDLEQQELLVLDLANLESQVTPEQLVTLGHALGNHHYPITVQGDKIYVQIVTDKLILEKLIHDLGIANLQMSYQTPSNSEKIVFSTHGH